MPPPRWIRRLLWPTFVAIELGLLCLCTAAGTVALVFAPFTRRRRVLRLAALGAAYLVMELAVLTTGPAIWLWSVMTRRSAEWWEQKNFAVLRRALSMILRAARHTVGFELVVDEKSMVPEAAGTAPVLVLSRHGGPGDSFAVVHLLLTSWQRSVRVVMKDILQWDPALDLVLNRLSACFISSRTRGPDTDQIARLAGELKSSDALLLFPEGANWTPTRQKNVARSLRRHGKVRAAWVAGQLAHVLPVRPAGVLACWARRPDLSLVVIAHTGLDKLVSVATAWRALPLHVPMVLRSWTYAAGAIPPDADAQLNWLTTEWAVVDEWIDSRISAPVPRA
jgi:1-acyl-sn-glycerol-3-phosphate acyltransferase